MKTTQKDAYVVIFTTHTFLSATFKLSYCVLPQVVIYIRYDMATDSGYAQSACVQVRDRETCAQILRITLGWQIEMCEWLGSLHMRSCWSSFYACAIPISLIWL